MARRLLCLYFPALVIDRLQRDEPARQLRPFAVTREDKGHLFIAAANTLASRAGITIGARLSDAKALLPNLETVADDPEANACVKQQLIDWCGRYSPLVADDRFGGIVLDITGCAHLFGGETALLQDLQTRVLNTGYRVRGAIADTLGAAWAVARYGKQVIVTGKELPDVLNPLPVEALRLPKEITAELRRVGLASIAAVRKIPRQPLAVRYGSGILLRLDQAFGQAEEPITPYYPPAPYRAGRTLAEPIGTVGAVEYVLLDLLQEVCSKLEKAHVGARQLNLDCYRVDGTVARCSVHTSKPLRSIAHLMRLFAERLDTLDAGFGIETLVLSAPSFDKAGPAQLSLPQFNQESEDSSAVDELIDRVGMRLGFQQVCRFRIRESLLPESAVEFRPVTAPVLPNAAWPEHRVRPVYLIRPAIPIEVSTLLPDELPVQFRMGRQLHRIVRVEGPERLTPEWWRGESLPWEVRDYYRIEDEEGARFWIFREKKTPTSTGETIPETSNDCTRWFLCGHLM
jgi:protein ImuB